MGRYKPRGWFGQSHRHSLAAKGISTKHNYFQTKASSFFQGLTADALGTSQRAKSRSKSLRSPRRVEELQSAENLQRRTVDEGQLTKDEEDTVQTRIREERTPEKDKLSDAWTAWQPVQTLPYLRASQAKEEELRKELKILRDRDSDSPIVRGRITDLKKDLEIQEQETQRLEEILTKVVTKKRPANELTKNEKEIVGRHAIESGAYKP